MKKTIPTVLAAALVVAGCAVAGRNAVEPAAYDLGAPPAARAEASVAQGVALDVRLPPWLDAPAIAYRLAYAEPQRLRHYAEARWVAPPAALLQQRLRQLMAMPAAAMPCILRVELDDFTQVFDSPTASRVELRGEAVLSGRNRSPLRLPLRIERAAAANAAAGAAAFAEAGELLAASLAGWLRQQDLAGCQR